MQEFQWNIKAIKFMKIYAARASWIISILVIKYANNREIRQQKHLEWQRATRELAVKNIPNKNTKQILKVIKNINVSCKV